MLLTGIVINLKHRADRWDRVTTELRKHWPQLPYERYDAVSPATLDSALRFMYTPDQLAPLSEHLLLLWHMEMHGAGKYCCRASHYLACRRYLEQPGNYDGLVVLEDDIAFTTDMQRYIEQLDVPPTFKLLQLSNTSLEPAAAFSPTLNVVRRTTSTAAYILPHAFVGTYSEYIRSSLLLRMMNDLQHHKSYRGVHYSGYQSLLPLLGICGACGRLDCNNNSHSIMPPTKHRRSGSEHIRDLAQWVPEIVSSNNFYVPTSIPIRTGTDPVGFSNIRRDHMLRSPISRVRVVTYMDALDDRCATFQSSFAKHGIPYEICGIGIPYHKHNNIKTKWVKSFFDNDTETDNAETLLVFVDAFDTAAVRALDSMDMITQFRHYECDILFAIDSRKKKEITTSKTMPVYNIQLDKKAYNAFFGTTDQTKMNAGFFCGRYETIRNLTDLMTYEYEHADTEFKRLEATHDNVCGDQLLLTYLYSRNKLDHLRVRCDQDERLYTKQTSKPTKPSCTFIRTTAWRPPKPDSVVGAANPPKSKRDKRKGRRNK